MLIDIQNLVSWLLIVLGGLWFCFWSFFGLVSVYERERRAAFIAFILGAVGASGFILPAVFAPYRAQIWFLWVIAGGLFLGGVIWILPLGKVTLGKDKPNSRFDERDIMFARARLRPGTPEYESYYTLHPENKGIDDKTRALPGLLSPTARYANRYQFASAEGSFWLTGSLREAVDGNISSQRDDISPARLTLYIKGLARYYGALNVGITPLKDYHMYSHIGRGSGKYGAPINLEHSYAIAFTVEMDFAMVSCAPKAPITMESARQYVEAARVAVQLASALRALGYSARAHIDGNYRVIAPLVARDAGLGEIGRMGLLMTPNLGPRVRIGVVTTSATLETDGRNPDASVIDFCSLCEKCANNCPSRSIPFGPRQEIEGVLRWRINPETCFRYWNVVGTDCGRCMAVCPYSHPDNLLHNLVRWGNQHSGGFRRLAFALDDLFYGKRPLPKDPPRWADPTSK